MNKFRPYLLALIVVFTSLLAACFLLDRMPQISDVEAFKVGKKSTCIILNIVLVVFFVLLFALEGVRGRIKPMKVMKVSGLVFGGALGIFALGELLAWLSPMVAGLPFRYTFVALFMIVTLFLYIRKRRLVLRESTSSIRVSAPANAIRQHAYTVLYGTLSIVFVISILVESVFHYNWMYFIPLACATIAMILHHMTNLKFCFIASIAVILLHLSMCLYILPHTMMTGALGAMLILSFFDIVILISLADLYLMQDRRR